MNSSPFVVFKKENYKYKCLQLNSGPGHPVLAIKIVLFYFSDFIESQIINGSNNENENFFFIVLINHQFSPVFNYIQHFGIVTLFL